MGYLTPEFIVSLSKSMGLKPGLVQKAVMVMAPAILGAMAKTAGTTGGAKLVAGVLGAQDPGLLGKVAGLVGDAHQDGVIHYGTSMARQMLGDTGPAELATSVARGTGIGLGESQKLLGLLTPLVSGAVAKQMADGGLDAGGLAAMLTSQAAEFTRVAAAAPGPETPETTDRDSADAATNMSSQGVYRRIVHHGRRYLRRGRNAVAAGASDVTGTATGAMAGMADRARDTAATISRVRDIAGPTVGAGVAADVVRHATGSVAEAARSTVGGIVDNGAAATSRATETVRAVAPEASDVIGRPAMPGITMTGEAGRRHGFGRLVWLVPLAVALGLIGFWWNSMQRSQQLAASAKAQAEVTAARVAAGAKAIADAAATAKLAADAAAARKIADDAAAAKIAADAAAAKKMADDSAAEKLAADAAAARRIADDAAAAKAAADSKMAADAKAAADAAADARRVADAKSEMDKGNAAGELARKAKAEADLATRDAQAAADARAVETRRLAEAKAETDRNNTAAELARKAKAEADLKERDARAAAAAKATADAQAAQMQAKIAACRSTLSEITATNRINFEFASAALKPDSKPVLDKVANAIKACPATRIRVEGHTDADGDENRNQRLSEARAKSVQAYLEQAGIETDRLTAIGYGQSRPAVPNTTDENKLANRRIELALEKY